ncbi:MAG: FtsH protease activity modulator HflK [Phyllobacteriaceae bacterium]|nr:FtsH protease activity modulator HflK [Phyllobacteriaceae bacterium]
MPWNNNQSGGPWGGGGNNNGPWGQGPKPGGPRNSPPDLEDLLRRGQDKLKQALPGGGGATPAVAAGIGLALLAFWGFQAIYTVQADQLGQELLLGKPKAEVSEPGLHFHWWPVERVEIVSTRQNRDVIGKGGSGVRTQSLMLSSDQNIVDVDFTVIWRVSDPLKYLFNVRGTQDMVSAVAESSMREFVGRSTAEDVRTERRQELEDTVRKAVQATLDVYGAGVTVVGVQLERADPPEEVADAFEEVQRAQQDQDKVQRDADAYANKRLGEARGEASRMKEEAQGYKQSVVAEAQGEAQRFISVYNEYAKAQDVTKKRLYLEMMEKVLAGSPKIIVDGKAGAGIVPYLPLDRLTQPAPTSADTAVKTAPQQ